MMKSVGLTLLILFSISGRAEEDCPEIDLTAGPNPVVKDVPLLQTAGFCYAHALAGLTAAITGEEVSALHIALLHNETLTPEQRNQPGSGILYPQGGDVFTSAKRIHDHGWVASKSCVISNNDHTAMTEIYSSAQDQPIVGGMVDRIIPTAIPNVCLPAARPDILQFLRTGRSLLMKTEEQLAAAVDHYCKGKNRISTEKTRFCRLPSYHVRPNSETIKRGTLWALQHGSPVVYNLNMNELKYSVESIPRPGWHSVLATGVKKINGVCHMIMRNSWGNSPCMPDWSTKFPQVQCNGDFAKDSFALPMDMAVMAPNDIVYSTTGTDASGSRTNDSYGRMMGGMNMVPPKCTN